MCHLNAGLGSCVLLNLLMSSIQTQVRWHLHDWQVRKSTHERFHPSAPISHTTLLIWIVLKAHFVGQIGLLQVWNPATYQLFFIPLTRTSYQLGQEMYWHTDKDTTANRFLRIPFFSGLKDEWVTEEHRITIICCKECYLIIWFLWESADQTIQCSLLIYPQHHWSWTDDGRGQISRVNKVHHPPAAGHCLAG